MLVADFKIVGNRFLHELIAVGHIRNFQLSTTEVNRRWDNLKVGELRGYYLNVVNPKTTLEHVVC